MTTGPEAANPEDALFLHKQPRIYRGDEVPQGVGNGFSEAGVPDDVNEDENPTLVGLPVPYEGPRGSAEEVPDDRIRVVTGPDGEEVVYVAGERKGKTTRTAIRTAGAVAIVGGLIFAGLRACDALAPHVTTITREDVSAELTKVQEDTAQNILTGDGQGTSQVSVSAQANFLFIHYTLPSWIVGQDAHVTLPRTEVVSLAPGAVTLEPVQEKGGQWETLALVNPKDVRTAIQGDAAPTDAGASSGFLNRVGQILHVDPNADQEVYQGAVDAAAQAFSASAAETMTDSSVTADGHQLLAAAIANTLRSDIKLVGEDATGTEKTVSAEIAKNPILIEYVTVGSDGQMTFLSPAKAQSEISLPKSPADGTTSVPAGNGVKVQFTVSTPGKSEVTDAVVRELQGITGQKGYQVVETPLDIPKNPAGAQ